MRGFRQYKNSFITRITTSQPIKCHSEYNLNRSMDQYVFVNYVPNILVLIAHVCNDMLGGVMETVTKANTGEGKKVATGLCKC